MRKLEANLSGHDQKILMAFVPWLMAIGDQDRTELRTALEPILTYVSALRHGREPSMYVDMVELDDSVHDPTNVVSANNAKICLQIAARIHKLASEHIRSRSPNEYTVAQNKFFAIKSAKLMPVFKSEDFWWYYIDRMESGDADMAAAAVVYLNEYKGRDRLFRTPQEPTPVDPLI